MQHALAVLCAPPPCTTRTSVCTRVRETAAGAVCSSAPAPSTAHRRPGNQSQALLLLFSGRCGSCHAAKIAELCAHANPNAFAGFSSPAAQRIGTQQHVSILLSERHPGQWDRSLPRVAVNGAGRFLQQSLWDPFDSRVTPRRMGCTGFCDGYGQVKKLTGAPRPDDRSVKGPPRCQPLINFSGEDAESTTNRPSSRHIKSKNFVFCMRLKARHHDRETAVSMPAGMAEAGVGTVAKSRIGTDCLMYR